MGLYSYHIVALETGNRLRSAMSAPPISKCAEECRPAVANVVDLAPQNEAKRES